jgi:polyferredoxin
MFEAYKNFVMNTTQNLFHPELNSFTEYMQVVGDSILVILSFLLIIAIIIGIVILPFVLHWKIFVKLNKEIMDVEYKLRVSAITETEEATLKILDRKKLIWSVLFIVSILIFYIPVVLPLIFIAVDNLWGSVNLDVAMAVVGVIALIVFYGVAN